MVGRVWLPPFHLWAGASLACLHPTCGRELGWHWGGCLELPKSKTRAALLLRSCPWQPIYPCASLRLLRLRWVLPGSGWGWPTLQHPGLRGNGAETQGEGAKEGGKE